MKAINKNTDYAVRILMVLAKQQGTFVSARTIADDHGIPYQFLRRIVQQLQKKGLVTTKEGIYGGVTLSKDPTSITVAEVIAIIQGKIELSECQFRHQTCQNQSSCVLRKEIKRIEALVIAEFVSLTIQGLVDQQKEDKK